MGILKFLVRLILGGGLLIYLLYEHEVELGAVARRAAALPLGCVLGAIALELGGRTLNVYRWSRISALGGHPVGFGVLWPIYFSGVFFNICLPTSIGGDLVRVLGQGRHIGSKTAALASVFMDRNVGMSALLTLGLASALLAPTTIQATFFGTPYVLPLWPLFLLLLAGFAAANGVLFGTRLYGWAERLAIRRLPERPRAKVEKLHAALQAYRRSPSEYAGVYGLSLLYQATEVASVYVLARGLGLELPFWVFGAVVTFQAVAGLLPITVNNIGVREGVFCAVLLGQAGLAGMSPDGIKDYALALSLAYFGLIVFSGLFGGLVYLLSGAARPSEAEAREAA